jgi:uracil-DNA glycosylase family 4
MFTGDRSGDWLYRALYRAGFASRAESVSRNDGLKLLDCYVTASARCAPPQNKLLPGELLNCRPYIVQEIRLLIQVRVVVALGKVASDAVYNCFREIGKTALSTRPKFAHGMECRLNERQMLLASYHPSQQNTFTGKLTEKMLDAVFTRARRLLQQS